MSLSNKELLDKSIEQLKAELLEYFFDSRLKGEEDRFMKTVDAYATEKAKELLPKEKKEPESDYKQFEEEDKFSIPSVRNSPRSWPEDYEHENGNYISVCGECNNSFMGHKRRVRCKLCMQSVESSEPHEKMSYWQYQQFAEAAITQLKEKNEILESDNKLLREEIERLKAEKLGTVPRMFRCSSTACTWPNCDCSKLF